LYSGATLADLRLLGATCDADLVEAVAKRLTPQARQASGCQPELSQVANQVIRAVFGAEARNRPDPRDSASPIQSEE